jgi:hypothetical protein
MRRPPREIAAEAERLARLDRTAEAKQLLAAVAVRRPDQEVAALIAVLRGVDRHSDADLVINASAQRPADEIVALLDVLRQIGSAHDADQVLDAIANGSLAEVGSAAEALAKRAWDNDLRRLLDSAIAAHRRPDDVIALIGALLSLGLGHEINRLLDRAAEGLTDSETAALADALRGAGRDAAAFRLYAAALKEIVRRPADAIASLVRAMRDANRDEDANRLINEVCAVGNQPDEIMRLSLALWSASLDDDSDRLLESAASTLAVEQITVLAEALREDDRYESALHLCTQAAAHHRVSATLTLVQALRDAGRPVDGHQVLESVQAWPSAKSAELVAILRNAGNDADADRILIACSRSAADQLSELVAALRSQESDDDAIKIIALAGAEGPSDACDLASALLLRNLDRDADQVMISAAAGSADDFSDLIAMLQGKRMDQLVGGLLHWESQQDPTEVFDRLVTLRQRKLGYDSDELLSSFLLLRPIADIVELANVLAANSHAFGAAAILSSLARQTSLFSAMREAGLNEGADTLLRTAAEKMTDEDFLAFFDALDKERRNPDVDYLIEASLAARPVSFARKLLDRSDGIMNRRGMRGGIMAFAAQRSAADINELIQALRQHGYFGEARQLRKHARRS